MANDEVKKLKDEIKRLKAELKKKKTVGSAFAKGKRLNAVNRIPREKS